MVDTQAIEAAKEQLEGVDRVKAEAASLDYSQVKPIVIGMLGGDGIGLCIVAESQRFVSTSRNLIN